MSFPKCLLLLSILIASSGCLSAQIPVLSPPAHVEQLVGDTKVTLDYRRPIARGRKIFGGLVSYGEIWMTGGGMSIS